MSHEGDGMFVTVDQTVVAPLSSLLFTFHRRHLRRRGRQTWKEGGGTSLSERSTLSPPLKEINGGKDF